MAEELAAGRIDAIGAAAEIDLVEIELEDLLLRELPLERHGEDRLAQLAVERPVVVEEDVARQLLADGRGTAHARTRSGQPLDDRAARAHRIDAEMRIIAAILDRDHRILHHLRDLVRGQPLAEAGAQLDDLGPVARAHDDGLRGLRRLELVIAGHRADRKGHCQADEQHQQQGQRGAPDRQPAAPCPQPARRCAARCGAAFLASRPLATTASVIHCLRWHPCCCPPCNCRNLAWRELTACERQAAALNPRARNRARRN